MKVCLLVALMLAASTPISHQLGRHESTSGMSSQQA